MEKLKQLLAPLTETLPPGVRDFLDAGGWWLVLGVLGLVILLVLWAILDRAWRFFRRKPARPEDAERELEEDLASYPPPPQPPGRQALTVYHIPVRLRLVVLAPAGTETSVDMKEVPRLLDQVVPGLSTIAGHDQAQIRLWPAQLSQQGFAITFQRRVERPEQEGQPSHWALVAGRAHVGKQSILLGLALWTDQPTTLDQVVLEPYQWLDVVRIKSAEA